MGEPRPRLRRPLPYLRRDESKPSRLDANLDPSVYLFWGEDRTSPGHLPPTPPRAPFPRPTACQARGGERLFYSLDPYGERQFSYPPLRRTSGPLPNPLGERGSRWWRQRGARDVPLPEDTEYLASKLCDDGRAPAGLG